MKDYEIIDSVFNSVNTGFRMLRLLKERNEEELKRFLICRGVKNIDALFIPEDKAKALIKEKYIDDIDKLGEQLQDWIDKLINTNYI